jgi:hypothetical protein
LLLGLVIAIVNKSAYPESNDLTLGASLRLNAWGLVALGVAVAASRTLHFHPDWAKEWRIAVALAPLAPLVLYLRAGMRWLHGLDEMQRRIQYEAIIYAAAGTGLAVLALDLLATAGCMPAIHFGLEGLYALAFALWILGSLISNRRFR